MQTTVAHCPLDTAIWHVYSIPMSGGKHHSITGHPEGTDSVEARLGSGLVGRVLGPNHKGLGQKGRESQAGCGRL